jgi:hypothetical protein
MQDKAILVYKATTTNGGLAFVDPVPLNPRPARPFAIGSEQYPTVDVATRGVAPSPLRGRPHESLGERLRAPAARGLVLPRASHAWRPSDRGARRS